MLPSPSQFSVDARPSRSFVSPRVHVCGRKGAAPDHQTWGKLLTGPVAARSANVEACLCSEPTHPTPQTRLTRPLTMASLALVSQQGN